MQSHLQIGIYPLPIGLLSSLLLFLDHVGLCKQVSVIHACIWSQFKTPRALLKITQVSANRHAKSHSF